MWQDDRGKGPTTEHVIDYQIRLSFYVNFIIYLYNFICVAINYFICLYNLNNIDFHVEIICSRQAMLIMIPPMRRGCIHPLIRRY
jgi:hypothetical protein